LVGRWGSNLIDSATDSWQKVSPLFFECHKHVPKESPKPAHIAYCDQAFNAFAEGLSIVIDAFKKVKLAGWILERLRKSDQHFGTWVDSAGLDTANIPIVSAHHPAQLMLLEVLRLSKRRKTLPE
jgi:hypothetical protein